MRGLLTKLVSRLFQLHLWWTNQLDVSDMKALRTRTELRQSNMYHERCSAASAVACNVNEKKNQREGETIFAGLRSHILVPRCGGKDKRNGKDKKKKTREAGNRKQTSRFESAARTFTRLMYKQHAKTSAAHTLATGLKLHQTIFLPRILRLSTKEKTTSFSFARRRI